MEDEFDDISFLDQDKLKKQEDKVKSGLIEQAIDDYQLILESYPNSKYAIQARFRYSL